MKAFLSIILLLAFGAYAYSEYTPEQIAQLKAVAADGDGGNQWVIGYMYQYGKDGTPQDDKEAVKWYRKAAEQGNASAQWRLGYVYKSGSGVPEDYVQVYTWWNNAAANGLELGKEYEAKVAEEMTKEQITKAQGLSLEMIKANP